MAADDDTNLSILNDAEREAAEEMEEQGEKYFEDDPETPEEESSDTASTEESAGDPEQAEAEEDPDRQEEPGEEEEPTDKTGGEPETSAATETTAADTAPFVPRLKADASPEEIRNSINELDEKFDSGDIEAQDYRTQMRDMERRLIKAEVKEEINTETSEQAWENAQERFYNQGGGENAIFRDNAMIRGAFGAALEELYADNDAAGKPHNWYLEEAARKVREATGIPGPGGKDKEPPSPPTPQNTGRGKGAKDVPQTLAGAPAANANDTGGDEFAHLDALEGMDLEKELMKMPESEVEKYLEGAPGGASRLPQGNH